MYKAFTSSQLMPIYCKMTNKDDTPVYIYSQTSIIDHIKTLVGWTVLRYLGREV